MEENQIGNELEYITMNLNYCTILNFNWKTFNFKVLHVRPGNKKKPMQTKKSGFKNSQGYTH